ncbi:hypothetical protein GA0070624_5091 [Micromonospora rhizosphaerae]|uniref:Uncharacterized protein n=1 Tax=Micromonospora rhizosphaerae TaxID=568872 RepID=A0A1C6SZK5_9ACTN|nr:hypothetical protein GA0070624_5091 [Micromonospora rhizosphaerae]
MLALGRRFGKRVRPTDAEEAERLGSLLREFSDSLGRRCSRYCEHLA